MKKKLSLPMQILIALIAGVIVGVLCLQLGAPQFTENYLKPFGDIFVNLLKFIVVPVVLLSMIDGILSMGNLKQLGSIGLRTLIFFTCTTAIACVIGLVIGSLFNNAGLFPVLAPPTEAFEVKEFGGFMGVLVGMFPSNLWKAFFDANMLQVIVIALFFGGAILAAGEKGQLCRDLISSLYAVVDKLMGFIIRLSPIGVFTYMAWVVATQGPKILGSLALVLLAAYIGYFVHAILIYSSTVKVFAGINPWTFFKGVAAAMMFGFTSASSAATLPVSKECAEELGADKDVAAFVLPLGATINMDGTAIYQCVTAIFLATCVGMDLSLSQMVTIVITATLASVGTAGTPGSGLIMLTMVLSTLNIPVDYIGLIFAVDRLFDMGRTCMNITGDISCTLCVSNWKRKSEQRKARA